MKNISGAESLKKSNHSSRYNNAKNTQGDRWGEGAGGGGLLTGPRWRNQPLMTFINLYSDLHHSADTSGSLHRKHPLMTTVKCKDINVRPVCKLPLKKAFNCCCGCIVVFTAPHAVPPVNILQPPCAMRRRASHFLPFSEITGPRCWKDEQRKEAIRAAPFIIITAS